MKGSATNSAGAGCQLEIKNLVNSDIHSTCFVCSHKLKLISSKALLSLAYSESLCTDVCMCKKMQGKIVNGIGIAFL